MPYVYGDKLNEEYQLTNHDLKGELKRQDSHIVNMCSLLKRIENAKNLPMEANQSRILRSWIIYYYYVGERDFCCSHLTKAISTIFQSILYKKMSF